MRLEAVTLRFSGLIGDEAEVRSADHNAYSNSAWLSSVPGTRAKALAKN